MMLIYGIIGDNRYCVSRKPFTTRIDENLLNKINALAAITERNINDIVEEALSTHLERFGKEDLIQQFLDIKSKATRKTTKK